MKSAIFFGLYSLAGTLALALNYYQLQRSVQSSGIIMFILITLVLALQIPFYFIFRQNQ